RAFGVARQPAREAEIPAPVVGERGRAVFGEQLLQRRDGLLVLAAVEVEPADEERRLGGEARARKLGLELAVALDRLVVAVGARLGARAVEQRLGLAIVAGEARPHAEQLLGG